MSLSGLQGKVRDIQVAIIPSEVRSLLGLESLRMASGHISRVRLNFFLTLFSDSAMLPGSTASKVVGSPSR